MEEEAAVVPVARPEPLHMRSLEARVLPRMPLVVAAQKARLVAKVAREGERGPVERVATEVQVGRPAALWHTVLLVQTQVRTTRMEATAAMAEMEATPRRKALQE
jgi:hypothetical protein